MAVYWLSSRLLDDQTYAQRHAALIAVVEGHDPNFWHETTSFVVFTAESTTGDLARELKRAINPEVDHFLLRRMEARSARICGPIPDRRIFSLMVNPATGITY